MPVGFDIWGVVAGALGVLSLLPILCTIVNSQLPSTKFKMLHDTMSETESLFRTVVEEGLLHDQSYIVETEGILNEQRSAVEDLRVATHRATSLVKEMREIFKGLSRRISMRCKEVKALRANISETSSKERKRLLGLNSRGVFLQSSNLGCTEPTQNTTMPYAPPKGCMIHGLQYERQISSNGICLGHIFSQYPGENVMQSCAHDNLSAPAMTDTFSGSMLDHASAGSTSAPVPSLYMGGQSNDIDTACAFSGAMGSSTPCFPTAVHSHEYCAQTSDDVSGLPPRFRRLSGAIVVVLPRRGSKRRSRIQSSRLIVSFRHALSSTMPIAHGRSVHMIRHHRAHRLTGRRSTPRITSYNSIHGDTEGSHVHNPAVPTTSSTITANDECQFIDDGIIDAD